MFRAEITSIYITIMNRLISKIIFQLKRLLLTANGFGLEIVMVVRLRTTSRYFITPYREVLMLFYSKQLSLHVTIAFSVHHHENSIKV